MPFDPEHDVIVQVYDSWYELFGALRELAKSVLAECVRANSDAALVVRALLGALNDGLRPHLTQWQARLRGWTTAHGSKPEYALPSPQEVQRQFPQYDALVADLHGVNKGLIEFAEQLRRLRTSAEEHFGRA